LDSAESKIFDISRREGRSVFSSLQSELPATFDYIDLVRERNGEISGLSTGFRDIDQITGGLQPGEMIVLASRPSMGKTALALTIAQNASKKTGAKCAIFSLEMTTQSLVVRLLMSEASVDQSALRKGYLSHSDYRHLQNAASVLQEAPIYIDDTGGITVLEIKAKCRRLAAEIGGLDLVVVDYLQLVAGDGKEDRKDLEVGEISRGLKLLSKELNCPVLALAQLNRGPEQRNPDQRRPMMGDLRESGAIEQDADVIAFIYRDEYYNKGTEEPGIAEIIFSKQRNGPTGTVKLRFEARHARFTDANQVTYRDDNEVAPSFDSGEFVGPADVSFDHDGGQDPI
jgi:replicative DNA helicase